MAMLTPEQQEAFSDILACGLMSVGQSFHEAGLNISSAIEAYNDRA